MKTYVFTLKPVVCSHSRRSVAELEHINNILIRKLIANVLKTKWPHFLQYSMCHYHSQTLSIFLSFVYVMRIKHRIRLDEYQEIKALFFFFWNYGRPWNAIRETWLTPVLNKFTLIFIFYLHIPQVTFTRLLPGGMPLAVVLLLEVLVTQVTNIRKILNEKLCK